MTKFNIHHNENVTIHNETYKTTHTIEKTYTDNDIRLQLFTAIGQNNLELIKQCSLKLTNIDYPDSKGTTALLFAVALNKIEVVKLLCELGANPDTQDYTGRISPLSLAQNLSRHEMVLCLIQAKEARMTNNLGPN